MFNSPIEIIIIIQEQYRTFVCMNFALSCLTFSRDTFCNYSSLSNITKEN